MTCRTNLAICALSARAASTLSPQWLHPSQVMGLFPPDRITAGYFIFLLHVHTIDLKMMNEKGYYNPIQMPIHSSMLEMCSFWSKTNNVFVHQSQYFPAKSQQWHSSLCVLVLLPKNKSDELISSSHSWFFHTDFGLLPGQQRLVETGYLASTAARYWPVA